MFPRKDQTSECQLELQKVIKNGLILDSDSDVLMGIAGGYRKLVTVANDQNCDMLMRVWGASPTLSFLPPGRPMNALKKALYRLPYDKGRLKYVPPNRPL
uniref:Uncharacterized protein n=1 Tax=Romanomermis culicivorax TaxID=13658 RepID=A0A915JTB7_ROMCU